MADIQGVLFDFSGTLCRLEFVEPARALMVGDSEEADGGAAALGCSVAIVDPLPTSERPDALLSALSAYGI